MDLSSCVDCNIELLHTIKCKISLQESKGKECTVCGDINDEWHCYQLPCNHYGHTRCIRQWFNTINKVICPWCRDATPIKYYNEFTNKWQSTPVNDTFEFEKLYGYNPTSIFVKYI